MDKVLKFLKKFRILKKVIEPTVLLFEYLRFKKILDLNREFKDKYKGKRCFIIGNGPSLKTQNLLPLKDEITFVVNNFMLSDLYEKIKPTFYAVSDSNFFDPSKEALVKNVLSLPTFNHKPICIFPILKKPFLEKNGMTEKLKILYMLTEYDKKRINKIDITKYIPKSFNVANFVLYVALGMGFSEIYLLGTDMTVITANHDTNGVRDDGGHFYDHKRDEDLKSFYSNLMKKRDNEFMLQLYYKVFNKFKLARDYAMKKGVKIVNLTPVGALDVFPLGRLDEVLKS